MSTLVPRELALGRLRALKEQVEGRRTGDNAA